MNEISKTVLLLAALPPFMFLACGGGELHNILPGPLPLNSVTSLAPDLLIHVTFQIPDSVTSQKVTFAQYNGLNTLQSTNNCITTCSTKCLAGYCPSDCVTCTTYNRNLIMVTLIA